jgi:uncharacterized delta-60 repeat protein
MKYFIQLLAFFIVVNLHAQPGSLDHSFGNAGIALGSFPTNYNTGSGIYQQNDGKLLNVGFVSMDTSTDDFYVLRYLADGTRDSAFGTNGAVTGAIGSSDDQAFDVIQQADGKILVVGSFDNPLERDVFIRRYDSTGVLDTGFANGGMVITDFQNGSDDGGLRVRIQPDGKILVCGPTTETVNYTTAIMLLRYNPDGTLDSTFGNGGKISFSQLAGDQFCSQFVLQPDGKILIVGATDGTNGMSDILALRFLPDGSLDNSFNGDGIFTYDSGDDDEGWAIALQPDGKILIGGLGITINGYDDLLLRLDSSGYPDSSFNSTGIVTKDHNLSEDYITSVLIQPDGKIITVGQSYDMFELVSLTRYLINGVEDNSFGNGGSILVSLGNDDSYSTSAILQTDNRIVITGSIETTSTSNNYTARFLNDSISTGIRELIFNTKTIYPVPASDKIYFTDFKKGSNVTVLDIEGKIIYQNCLENNSLDINFLTPGVYFLRTDSGHEQSVQRFIKK